MTGPPPAPSRWAAAAFGRYLDRLLRGTFSTVRWRRLDEPAPWPADVPVLAIANHTSWWDGFLSHQLTRALGRSFRILMEAEHLGRYRVFRRVGALPLERRSARQAVRDLEVASQCLAEPGATLWIYPQGMRRPAGEVPTRLEHGAAWLLGRHRGPLLVVPTAFRYPFLSEQRPEAFALIGSPWLLEGPVAADRRAITARLAAMLVDTLAALDADLAAERVAQYQVLVTGRGSINNRLDRVRHALGLLPDHQERNG